MTGETDSRPRADIRVHIVGRLGFAWGYLHWYGPCLALRYCSRRWDRKVVREMARFEAQR
jgi:hypothetical protein